MTAPWAERCGCLCPTCPTLRGRLERSWHPERAINDLQIQRFLSKKTGFAVELQLVQPDSDDSILAPSEFFYTTSQALLVLSTPLPESLVEDGWTKIISVCDGKP